MPRESEPDAGLTARWLGHSTVALGFGETRLLTDPLLGSSLLGLLRRRHALDHAAIPSSVDAVLLSHADRDHLDLPSLRRLPRETPLVAAGPVGPLLQRAGLGPVRDVERGETLEIGGVEIEAVHARHQTRRRGVEAGGELGFVMRSAAGSAYFAGDTDLFEEMDQIGAAGGVDLGLIPIGGWGPTIGEGHLDPERAAEAVRRIGARVAIPIHWGTYTPALIGSFFPWLLDGPQHRFAEAVASVAPECEVRLLDPGQLTAVAASGGEGGGSAS